jgi:N utilization substance protein B
MATRRRAREIVLQVLYELDLHQDQDLQVAQRFVTDRLLNNRPLVDFAKNLLTSVRKHQRQVDQALSAKAKNWSLRRMSAIDRNILRIAAYEILMTSTPGPVVINEAIEIAKRYGDKNSGQFVNGVLDRLLQDKQSHDQSVRQAESSAERDAATSV